MSISLDGFVAASGISPDEPLGVGGTRLHDWVSADTDDRSRELLDRGRKTMGAMITGRRTYDASMPWWGTDGPTGEDRLPVFVLTHRASPPTGCAPSSPTAWPARYGRPEPWPPAGTSA